jgi:tripartite-type tricarboxylate transporter receptor subunit TctC
VLFDNMASAVEYIRAGRVRPLAVTTASRSPLLPDLPTIGETLPGYEASSWYGVIAPRGTAPEIVGVLNREINAALADREIVKQLLAMGGAPLVGSPADFGRLIAEETEKWAKVVRFAGVKPG